MIKTRTPFAIAAVALSALLGNAFAHDQSQHGKYGQHGGAAQGHVQHDGVQPGTVRIKLPDTTVLDQHGKAVRFRSDVIGDRLVMVNFIYTTCSTVCPIQSAVFAELQKQLGDRVGKDIAMVSVTVDPLRDTPARLREFAAQYDAGPAWRFVTGTRQAVDEVLTTFNVYTRNFADHPSMVLVGDPRTGEWTRFYGFPGAEQIMARMTQLHMARSAPLAKNN